MFGLLLLWDWCIFTSPLSLFASTSIPAKAWTLHSLATESVRRYGLTSIWFPSCHIRRGQPIDSPRLGPDL
ncbi:hypothetical protein C8J57DRAFT_705198 [Mycena rebaudengoi]|nr:hypothetical protein C8J57DRAFT_705198 [Mycena rebaudengoi]